MAGFSKHQAERLWMKSCVPYKCFGGFEKLSINQGLVLIKHQVTKDVI